MTDDTKNLKYFQPHPTKETKPHFKETHIPIKYEEEIDLSLLKEHGKLKFSEPNKFIESSHEFTKEELDKLYSDYEKYENSKPLIEEPKLERGFKPIYNTKNRVTQPRFRPGLIKTGKKPHTTPGLKNYGVRGYQNYVFPPTQSSGKRPRVNYTAYFNPKGPILFPPSPEETVKKSDYLPRLFQNQAKNGYSRYGKYPNRY